MRKFFSFLFGIAVVAAVIEVVDIALGLLNSPSDVAVLSGVLLLFLAGSVVIAILKHLHEGRVEDEVEDSEIGYPLDGDNND